MPEPAVSVALAYAVPLPINKAPFAGGVDKPVPPLATVNTPAKPVIFIKAGFNPNAIEPALFVNVKPPLTDIVLPS